MNNLHRWSVAALVRVISYYYLVTAFTFTTNVVTANFDDGPYDYVVTFENNNNNNNELGSINYDVTIGNPFKGFMDHPEFPNHDPMIATNIYNTSLEAYYIGLDELLVADPNIVGIDQAFAWESFERRLNRAARYQRHVVITIMCHYPNWNKLSVPQYIIDSGLELLHYPDFLGGGYSPNYGDNRLLNAFELFITEFGKKYDGDPRIGFIHLGLLGFWGEWHTFPHDFVPEHAKEKVVQWYQTAFQRTKLLIRYPYEPAYKAGFGLIDSSFTYETLDGGSNGNEERSHYFWPSVQSSKQTNFWRTAPMGGETRPEQQPYVFETWYEKGTYQKQDFMECVTTTHASYMAHHDMFIYGGYIDQELDNALHAHVRMGYNFIVAKIATKLPDNLNENPTIQIDVTIKQIGVAPFYYPLSLLLDCRGLNQPLERTGVETIIDKNDVKTFSFENVPRTESCMRAVSLSLYSSQGYSDRPIKFAQGQSGEMKVEIPIPTTMEVPDEQQVPLQPVENATDVQVLYMLYRLVNADIDIDEGYGAIESGATIDLAEVGRSLTIQVYIYDNDAEIQDNIKVEFRYDYTFHTEFRHPYTLNGKIGTDYIQSDYISTVGAKAISTIVTSSSNGEVLLNDVLIFRVIDSSTEVPVSTPIARSLSDIRETQSDMSVEVPPSIAEIHGFNIPGTPSILELEDERRKIAFRNHILIPLIAVTGIVTFLVLFILYKRNRRRKQISTSSTMNNNWDVLESKEYNKDNANDATNTTFTESDESGRSMIMQDSSRVDEVDMNASLS